MSIPKILGIALAGFIIISALIWSIFVIITSGGSGHQNAAPAPGRQAVSPRGDMALISQTQGSSSFLYRKSSSSGKSERLTAVSSGLESEPSFSHDGKFVVYTFAESQDAKASVWVINADGQNSHQVSAKDEDVLHPVFSPDDSKVFFAVSNYTGNHSPIVRPARHAWDVFSLEVNSDTSPTGSVPTQITHGSFYDLNSLDVAADGVNPGGTKILISTYGYPIGALFEEFPIGDNGRDKIFQPHVQGESKTGPSFGDARFIHDGMDILFLSATDSSNGVYDYNVYSMSDVTGSEIKQLTHLKGMTTALKVLPDGNATFINDGTAYVLDIDTQSIKPL